MKIINERIRLSTNGSPDLVNITDRIAAILKSSNLKRGNLTVFVVGSTLAVTTFEYEPGLVRDMQEMYEKLVPSNRSYSHDDTWGDANGFSHLRSALQGTSFTVPFDGGKLLLGTWQQVVIADFDNRSRQREIVVQLIGE